MTKKDTILLVCDDPSQANSYKANVAYWRSYENEVNTFSIPEVVDNNESYLKEKYLKWLYELGTSIINGRSIIERLALRKDFSMWWMSLLIEKSQWKSPQLYNVFRLMALELIIIESGATKVIIAITDKDICKAIITLCENKGINYDCIGNRVREKTPTLSSLYNMLPYTFQAIFWLVRYSISNWVGKKVVKREKDTTSKRDICFISYLFNLDMSVADKGYFYTRFWTALHKLLKQEHIGSNWQHILVKSDSIPNTKDAVGILNKFNASYKNTQAHSLLVSELSIGLLARVFYDYIKIWFAGIKLGSIKHLFKLPDSELNIWHLMKHDYKCSIFGPAAISNSMFLNLFEKSLSKLPQQQKGFYLLENQAWERSFIYAWRKAGHGEIMGVPHTAIRDWDLRHYFSKEQYTCKASFTLPLPDKVLLNGSAAINKYRENNFPLEKIEPVEALRYLYLDKIKGKYNQSVEEHAEIRILILGDSSFKVTKKQLKLLALAVEDMDNIPALMVKPHPNCPIKAEDWPTLNLKIVTKPLSDLVDEYDIAYTSNPTTSAVDAYLAGKTVAVMLESDSFNMSALRGYAGVKFIFSPNELKNVLTTKHDSLLKQDDDIFFTDTELPKWKMLVRNA